MLRYTPILLLLASCGIFGSSEDEEALARYQRNAALYYEGDRFDQALDQVRRGLEIDPDDYKLNLIRGWCLLRQTSDARLLGPAAEQLDRVLELRGLDEQEPQALLGYAIVHGRMGFEQLGRAEQLRNEARRLKMTGDELERRQTEATELETSGRENLDLAEAQLQRLIDNGDRLLEAHYNTMYVKVWRNDYAGAIEHGNAYLTRVAALQDSIRRDLEHTLNIDYERELRIRLQRRIDEEIEVRAFLANLHYKQGHHELVVQQLDEVLTKNPQLYNEYYNRGRSELALGKAVEAKRDLEKFLATTRLPREHEEVQNALRLLREL
jgi:tetratricopeptide (TPR) repeat protein